MSKNKKIIIFYTILASFIFIPVAAMAYTLQMPLPKAPSAISDWGQYVQYLFQFGFYLIAFLAVAMITYGGILYMVPNKIAEAKERIWGAVIGIVFLICSYLILQTIDPNLLNLTPRTPAAVKVLEGIMTEEMDVSTTGMTSTQMSQTLTDGKITGRGRTTTCPSSGCSTQAVQGHQLATGAAANYSSIETGIRKACASQGLTCDTMITSTVDGQHASSCHKAGNAKSGTCGDFVITATECGGSIKLCSPAIKEKYIQVASDVLKASSNVSSCLNEYKVQGSSYTTGGHFHCNF